MKNPTTTEIASDVDRMYAREWEEHCGEGLVRKKRKAMEPEEPDADPPKSYATRAIEFGGVEIVDRDEGEERYYEPGD